MAYKFRVSAQILRSPEDAIPVKLPDGVLAELTDCVGKTGAAIIYDDWSYTSYEKGAKECKA
jgi:hypothetical protein